jgi:transketolase
MNKEIRKKLIENAYEKKMGHLGSALSCLDYVNYLYDNIMTEDDIFIMSKGHGAMALYVVLEKHGKKPDWTMHPELNEGEGIFATTGSLGHGLPIGLGRAFGKKLKGKGRVFVLIGDCEIAEGSIWETLILANRLKLDNFHIIVDWNKYGGLSDETMTLFGFDGEDIATKVRAFGFNAIIINGHDEKELNIIKPLMDGKTIFILDTIKGKGIKELEKIHFHGYYLHQNLDVYKEALEDLS